jgi:hypothetical protein
VQVSSGPQPVIWLLGLGSGCEIRAAARTKKSVRRRSLKLGNLAIMKVSFPGSSRPIKRSENPLMRAQVALGKESQPGDTGGVVISSKAVSRECAADRADPRVGVPAKSLLPSNR